MNDAGAHYNSSVMSPGDAQKLLNNKHFPSLSFHIVSQSDRVVLVALGLHRNRRYTRKFVAISSAPLSRSLSVFSVFLFGEKNAG